MEGRGQDLPIRNWPGGSHDGFGRFGGQNQSRGPISLRERLYNEWLELQKSGSASTVKSTNIYSMALAKPQHKAANSGLDDWVYIPHTSFLTSHSIIIRLIETPLKVAH